MSNAKKARNRVDRMAGKTKEKLGEFTGDRQLRNEGRTGQAKARIKMAGERLKDAFRGR